MKKHINLFTNESNGEQLVKILKQLKSVAMPLFFICILLILLELVGFFYVNNRSAEYYKTLKTLSQFIEINSNFDSKIKFFIYKKKLIDDYLAQDAQGYVYYEKMKTVLAENMPYATLVEFQFDNTKTAEIILKLKNYEDLISFLNALETPEFLKNFTFVTIPSLDPTEFSSNETELNVTIQTQFEQDNGQKS